MQISSPLIPCAATISQGRDFIIFIIIGGRLSFGVLQRRRGIRGKKKTSLTSQTNESPGLCLSSDSKKVTFDFIFRLNIILYWQQVADGQLWLDFLCPVSGRLWSTCDPWLQLQSQFFEPVTDFIPKNIWKWLEQNSCYFSESCFCCSQLF